MKFYAIAGVALSALFAASLGTPADAQQWPARQVRLIVPYPAGGNVDSAARVIGHWGVLKLTLGREEYSYAFLEPGGRIWDPGGGRCH